MTKAEQFTTQAEAELRTTSKVSAETCRSSRDLDAEGRAAFAHAVNFICGEQGDYGETAVTATRPTDRLTASRLMLLKLRLQTPDPRWSSSILDRYVRAVLAVPGGTLSEVFNPLLDLLGESSNGLSQPVAQFLKDLVVLCFTRYRKEYDSVPWANLAETVSLRPTQAKCYFGLHAIPPQYMTSELARLISERLSGTRYWEEAMNVLAV
jgi:hypothetical protein